MRARALVIALGQPVAGDDGAGVEVLARLREAGLPDGVELIAARDASALLDLLRTRASVILVDAVLAERAGEVLELSEDELALRALASVSSHGLGVGQAIALARELAPGEVSPDIRIVAVTIARPARHGSALSPEVAAAVPRAAAAVRALLERGVGEPMEGS
jgi:hydrogenase maturation protease